MTTGTNDHPDSAPAPEVEKIEADIARTREELTETVDELTARLDVKARLRQRIDEIRERVLVLAGSIRARATDDDGRPTPATVEAAGATAAVAAVAVGLLVWRRWRR